MLCSRILAGGGAGYFLLTPSFQSLKLAIFHAHEHLKEIYLLMLQKHVLQAQILVWGTQKSHKDLLALCRFALTCQTSEPLPADFGSCAYCDKYLLFGILIFFILSCHTLRSQFEDPFQDWLLLILCIMLVYHFGILWETQTEQRWIIATGLLQGSWI